MRAITATPGIRAHRDGAGDDVGVNDGSGRLPVLHNAVVHNTNFKMACHHFDSSCQTDTVICAIPLTRRTHKARLQAKTPALYSVREFENWKLFVGL